jgi:hypothetical protein
MNKKNTFSKNYMFNYLKKWIHDNHADVYKQLTNLNQSTGLEEFYKYEMYPLFINRMKKALIDMAFGDIKKALFGNSILGAFILCSCYIDYLAFYYSDKSNVNERYKEFVQAFLPNYDKEKLYKDLRCKMVHNYSEGGSYLFVHNNSSMHLKIDDSFHKAFINLENLIQELYIASEKLFELISKDEKHLMNAVKRHKEAPLLRAGYWRIT